MYVEVAFPVLSYHVAKMSFSGHFDDIIVSIPWKNEEEDVVVVVSLCWSFGRDFVFVASVTGEDDDDDSIMAVDSCSRGTAFSPVGCLFCYGLDVLGIWVFCFYNFYVLSPVFVVAPDQCKIR